MHWLGILKGGPGSGNFGHAGRPGEVGGSAPDDSSGPAEVPSAPDKPRESDLVKLGKYDDWRDTTGKRRVTLFHYSREDRSGSGLSRGFAGTAGAGEEKRSFEYDKEGRLIPESTPIHAYMYGSKKESMVPGNVLHKIEADLNVIDVGSKKYGEILAEASVEAAVTGRPKLALARAIALRQGYDALSSERDGIVQILRDVKPEELEVVGKKEKGGGGSGYSIGPPKESAFVKEASKRWDVKLKNLGSEKPEFEMYSLQNVAAHMIDRGLLTKDERHAVLGNMVGSDLPDLNAINKKVDELKSKIPPNATEKDREYIDKLFKYSIAHGKTSDEIRNNFEEQQRNILKENNRVAVRVPIDFVDEVADDGRFKSQFETGRSQGLLNEDRRSNVEYEGFGVPKDIEPEKRPIYGYMSNESGNHDLVSLEYYGGVAFILKDGVKERTTVTFGDSLDHDLPGSKISEPKIESMRITEGLVTVEGLSYVEAQIHGGVKIDEVDEIILNSSTARHIVDTYEGGSSNNPGDFDGFKAKKFLESGVPVFVAVKIPMTGYIEKYNILDWIESDKFKKDFAGTEEGDAFIAHVEAKYGKKAG